MDAGKAALDAYRAAVKSDKRIQALQTAIDGGRGTYAMAGALASRTGRVAGKAITNQIKTAAVDGHLEKAAAAAILQPTMVENHRAVSAMVGAVQKTINKKAGLGLAPLIPGLNQDRIDGLADEIANAVDVLDLSQVLVSQIENASMSIVDDCAAENMEFQHGVGRHPKIIRIAEPKCCQWCEDLAGEYDYAQVKQTGNDVYRRHENCRCIVEFDPGSGSSMQNAHSKRMVDRSTIERRKADQARYAEDAEVRKQNRKQRYGTS